MENRMIKLYSRKSNKAALHAVQGHFATSHSHINYYIDVTSLKTRVNEAKEVASLLVDEFVNEIKIDTIVCLDGTEVIGGFMGDEFDRRDFVSTNMHETIYVVTPEFNRDGQMMFRENNVPAIRNKHVILLTDTATLGLTIRRSIECIRYYGGKMEGAASIFSMTDEIEGFPIRSVFTKEDVPGYASYPQKDCPICKSGHRLEAMVNGYGYSRI